MCAQLCLLFLSAPQLQEWSVGRIVDFTAERFRLRNENKPHAQVMIGGSGYIRILLKEPITRGLV